MLNKLLHLFREGFILNAYTLRPNEDLEHRIRQHVKQEVKNNDDELRYIKQELVKLSYEVIFLRKEKERIDAERSCESVSFKNQLLNLENKYESTIQEHKDQIEILISSIKLLKDCVLSEIEILKEKKASSHEMMIYRNDLYNKMKFILDKVESHKTDLQNATTIINEKIKSTAEELKNSIPEKPNLDKLVENITESHENIALDIKALVKEIEILKHSQKYNDKKFENIYTLIERLKSKVDP